MKAHGFEPIPEIPYQCSVCRRGETDRLHDSWHLRLAWHPLTIPAILALTVLGVVLGQVLR